MKVKATQSFIDDFEKDFSRYHFSIIDLVEKMLETPMIAMKYPMVKCKFYIRGVSIRGFCIVKDDTIIPLYMTTKNSRLGENLVLDKEMTKKIDKLLEQYTQELIAGTFTVYER